MKSDPSPWQQQQAKKQNKETKQKKRINKSSL